MSLRDVPKTIFRVNEMGGHKQLLGGTAPGLPEATALLGEQISLLGVTSSDLGGHGSKMPYEAPDQELRYREG